MRTKSFTVLKRGDDTFASRERAKASHRIHIATDDYTVSTAFLLERGENHIVILTKQQNPKKRSSYWVTLKVDKSRLTDYRLMEM